MKRYKVVISVIWLLFGVVYLIYSGQADGIDINFTVLESATIALIFAIVINILQIMGNLIKNNHERLRKNSLYILPKLLAVMFVFAGHQIDAYRIKESMLRGDALVRQIEEDKTRHGNYPAAITEETFQKFRPALNNSKYFYTKEHQEQFSVGFHSTALQYCTRVNTAPAWHCHD